ncbi:MAG TPA: putative glycolipid-binding domain-containing protein, partial [Blastocatellia bacterium]|nr:putative glycolipid-binding domain-containing protein [Blastocatellia bacterium]
GAAVFSCEQLPCLLEYRVDCDSRWHTQSAKIEGWLGNTPIEIKIGVSADQHWSLNDEEVLDLAGCFDLDLNFSPSTNLLPIRRLDLAVGQEAEVCAAWLRFPSFKLEPLVQVYRRIDATTYHYESGGGDFVTQLRVNDRGFVIQYPNFWEIEGYRIQPF